MFIPRRIHYFSHELNREVVELYWQTALYNLATNLTYIFEPIFLYKLGFSLVGIMTFYLVLYTAYAILVIPITKITAKIGYKHAIFIASVFYVLYWFFLYQIKFHPSTYLIVPILFALQKSFFWPPYNADISINNAKDQRGREVGVLFSVIELVAIVGPVVGGFISYAFGFPTLFVVSAVIMMSSVYPLFRSPEIYSRHNFRIQSFITIFRKYPFNFFAYWGYAEDLMLMSLWPILMFLILPQFFSIGLIVTVASIIAVVVMLYIGKLLDAKHKWELLPIGAVFYGITWLLRIFVNSVSTVVGFDIVTRIGKALVTVPMFATTYAIAGTNGPDHAIAYSVFYEFSLSIGKIFTSLIAIWILSTTNSIPSVFLVVGVLTMFYGFLRKK